MPPPGGADAGAAQHVVARTAVCVCAFFCMGLSVGLVGPLLPFLKASTRLTPNGLSACFVARGLGSFVGSMAGGAATDRFPGHHVVLVSLLGLASATALLPAARSSAGLVFLFLCRGAFRAKGSCSQRTATHAAPRTRTSARAGGCSARRRAASAVTRALRSARLRARGSKRRGFIS
jgi:predicted MFS family arabinose efflux permease